VARANVGQPLLARLAVSQRQGEKEAGKKMEEDCKPSVISTTLPCVERKYPVQLYPGGFKQISNKLHGL